MPVSDEIQEEYPDQDIDSHSIANNPEISRSGHNIGRVPSKP